MNPTNNPIPTGPATHTRNKIIGLIAIVVVIVAVVLYASNGSRLSPQEVLGRAALTTIDAKALHTQATIKASFSLNKTPQELTLKIIGDADKTDETNPKVSMNVSFIGFGLNGDADLKVIDRNLYIKINQFPLFPLVSAIAGKWLSLSENDLKELARQYGTTTITSFDLFDRNTSQKESLAIYKIIQDSGMISDLKVSGTSVKNGVKVKTYTINADKASTKKAMAGLIRLSLDKQPKNNKTPAMSEQELLDKTSEIVDQTVLSPITIDVGTTDNLIHGLRFNISDKPEENSTSTAAFGQINVDFDGQYSNYNQKISIESPATSERIVDLLNSYQKQAAKTKSNSLPASVKTR